MIDLRAPRPKHALPRRGADVAHEGVVFAVAASMAPVVVVRKVLRWGGGGRGEKGRSSGKGGAHSTRVVWCKRTNLDACTLAVS